MPRCPTILGCFLIEISRAPSNLGTQWSLLLLGPPAMLGPPPHPSPSGRSVWGISPGNHPGLNKGLLCIPPAALSEAFKPSLVLALDSEHLLA